MSERDVLDPQSAGHASASDRAAADFDRPLLLSARQDKLGFVGRLSGNVFMTVVASLTILAVVLIFVFIARESLIFLRERSLTELLGSTRWTPTHESTGELTPGKGQQFGALAIVYGSAIVTAGSILIAVPLGVLGAVFLSDIISFNARQIVKPVFEILAAIPSVAYGFFAIMVVAPWLQDAWGMTTGGNALNASVILAVMAIPTVVSISEDALTAIGRELREGGYSLGATRAEVMVKVIIPAAHSGIIAAVILGVMRAVGETMLVWMAAGGATNVPTPWWDLTASVRTLTATIAAEMAEAEKQGMHYSALFTLGLLLLGLTFVLNLISEFFLSRAKRAIRGSTK